MPRGKPTKAQNVVYRQRGTLGETSGSSDDDDDILSASEAVVEQRNRTNRSMLLRSGAFHTPDNDSNATDYGLEFTTSQIADPARCSTFKTGSSQDDQDTTPKSSSRRARPQTAAKQRPQNIGTQEVSEPGSGQEEQSEDDVATGSRSQKETISKTASKGRATKASKQSVKPKGKLQSQKSVSKDATSLTRGGDEMDEVAGGEEMTSTSIASVANGGGSPRKTTKQPPPKSKGKSQSQRSDSVGATSLSRGDEVDDVDEDLSEEEDNYQKETTTTTAASLARKGGNTKAKKQSKQKSAAKETVAATSLTREEVEENLTEEEDNYQKETSTTTAASLARKGGNTIAKKQPKQKSAAKDDAQPSTSNSAELGTHNENSAAAKKAKSRKQKTPMQLNRRFLREVRVLQNRTDFLIPRLPFSRLIREIIRNAAQEVTQITSTALEALQTASEMYLTQRLQDAYMLTLHRGRVTLDVRDMELINYLKMYL